MVLSKIMFYLLQGGNIRNIFMGGFIGICIQIERVYVCVCILYIHMYIPSE